MAVAPLLPSFGMRRLSTPWFVTVCVVGAILCVSAGALGMWFFNSPDQPAKTQLALTKPSTTTKPTIKVKPKAAPTTTKPGSASSSGAVKPAPPPTSDSSDAPSTAAPKKPQYSKEAIAKAMKAKAEAAKAEAAKNSTTTAPKPAG
jgi:hypothetical protein